MIATQPKNYPFYDWVPKPIGILILLFMFVPILTVGGVYTANTGEMVSGLGITTDHIQFVSFATSIGMAAFAPFFYQLVCIRREKMMCIIGFAIMFGLSFICAKTDSIFLLALCSIIMGFLRMVLMMVNLFTLIKYGFGMEATINISPGKEPTDEKGWDALDLEKSNSQPIIYLFFMVLGQVGTWLTAWLAYEYKWQYVYYYMMATLMFCILLMMLTMRYEQTPFKKHKVNFRKFGNVVIFCLTWLSFVYVLVYGKTLDWYDDSSIRWATISFVFFGAAFVYLEMTRRSPYFLLEIFKLRTIRMGIMLFALLMIMNSSSMFVNVYTSLGMQIDNWKGALLNNWCIAGYALGCIVTMMMRNKNIHFKYVFAGGFLLIGLYAMFMYFEVQNAGLYERMKYPVIIRCTGMMMLYALTAVYANQRMPFKYMSTWICIMLTTRMVIGPVIGVSLYSNVMQHRQQHYITRFASGVDEVSVEASANYQQTVRGMQYMGKSYDEAQNMAALSTKGKIQMQATITAVKEMAGWTIYGCLTCMILVLVIPYPKRKITDDVPAAP